MATSLTQDTQTVAQGMALIWSWHPSNLTLDVLSALNMKRANGKGFTHMAVSQARDELLAAGLMVNQPTRPSHGRLTDPDRLQLYRVLLNQFTPEILRQALTRAVELDTKRSQGWPRQARETGIAMLRLGVYTGSTPREMETLWQRLRLVYAWNELIGPACNDGFDADRMPVVDPQFRVILLHHALKTLSHQWDASALPVFQWMMTQPVDPQMAPPLRYQLAETLLHRGELGHLRDLLRDDDNPEAEALRACALVQEGQWASAQKIFESTLKTLRQETGARKQLLPETILWLYPLCLLAQQSPNHLLLARKFCLTESGSRNPSTLHPWGAWVHAIDVRLGDAALNSNALYYTGESSLALLWLALLRAWLGPKVVPAVTDKRQKDLRQKAIATVHERLRDCGFTWLEAQLTAADVVYGGGTAPENCFIGGGVENWQMVLTSLRALGTPAVAPNAPDKPTRLVWAVTLDQDGAIQEIRPLEQKQGARGWGAPKPITLAKLANSQRLEPWDAQLVLAIHARQGRTRDYFIDRAAAIIALVGHPSVVMSDAVDITVDVVAGTPDIEVTHDGKRYILEVRPNLRVAPAARSDYFSDGSPEKREQEALRAITVVRDSPQRIRVVQFTPAQRHAVQLMSGRLSIPEEAQPELQQTLESLAGHFQIQSDHATATREMDADPHLRAELSPVGDGLMLRLVVAPLGLDGPRLMPGSGHARVMAAVKGETVGAMRNLEAEGQHLSVVLDGLPFLAAPGRGDVVCEWVVDDPESALSMVEVLPTLPAIAAVDWPRGKGFRVLTVSAQQLSVQISSGRDWFAIKGRAQVDEGVVLELEALFAAAAGNSRFVPMGTGLYVALTRDLRDRLRDLGAIAEQRADGLRVPTLAASWLKEALEGASTKADKGFLDKVERLRAAQDQVPTLPASLQADLRPYQEDGYVWAMRLAEAGFGACLADDMGLGKTLQAIAVMLARAEDGPALVIAPTSVCGNWLAEVRRFAPTLQPFLYGNSDRDTLLEKAGPMDVVIVSYTMVQQAQEAFSGRDWRTLVVDEAQVIKNAVAKRSQAIFQIPADFRMALSGTPVENRLSELWSIMRFCNPALLGPLSRFNERFAGPIERNRDREAQRLLRRLIAPFVLRRTKTQVLDDLPPRTELVLSLALEGAEAAHYEALRRQAIVEAEAAVEQSGPQAHFHILAQLTKLRRAACDPRLVSPDLDIVGAKVRTFTDLAVDLSANGHKALVFSQFVDFLTLLREPLDAAGIAYQYLDGSTPVADRERRINAFQAGKGDLFLISLKAGGFGLNLTAADYVIITDPWWNPAAEDQAMGRAHRMGQLRPVTVYRLVAQGTLEEQIIALHHDKRALADGVLADGGESMSLPSREDLLSLMRG
ncbi:DEAD/DEAH box helicase [Acidithiobacillus ferrivorans]|uniref:DEAD/DEAH box helicase n=1 Tax=Acidithiobacillus ferrivorans TaxID=160808 RepID=UPI001CBC695C|nr:DEAD/DEAH box helicase [Acidithiobacillus ferrivorans]